jgi:uncharacterized protein YpiB (UPF0302 family)
MHLDLFSQRSLTTTTTSPKESPYLNEQKHLLDRIASDLQFTNNEDFYKLTNTVKPLKFHF